MAKIPGSLAVLPAAVRVAKHNTKCPWGSKTDVLRESGATGGVDGGRSRGKT